MEKNAERLREPRSPEALAGGAAGRPAAALILAAEVRAVYRKYIVIGDSLCEMCIRDSYCVGRQQYDHPL